MIYRVIRLSCYLDFPFNYIKDRMRKMCAIDVNSYLDKIYNGCPLSMFPANSVIEIMSYLKVIIMYKNRELQSIEID